MSEQMHTPEPWHVDGWRGLVQGSRKHEGTHYAVWAADDDTMICPTGLDAESEANARRIVACVNACAGLDTDTLEHTDIAEALDKACLHTVQQRDELLVALRELRRQCMEGTTQRELIDAAIAKAQS